MSELTTEKMEDILERLWLEAKKGSDYDEVIKALAQLLKIVNGEKIEELKKFEEWFQQYAHEMHISHVCPQDNIGCANFRGRIQKACQIHGELLDRIKQLKGTNNG